MWYKLSSNEALEVGMPLALGHVIRSHREHENDSILPGFASLFDVIPWRPE